MNKNLQPYPSRLASYDEVVADKDLFMSTLMKLHSQMGTKFWIPKVRFEDMNLHKVFVEVTSHGGIEQIVREQKWKEVFDRFNFPKSQRNPIFIKHVRRIYYLLLHDYEIIYFFKARGLFPPLIGFVYGKNESGYLVTFTMGSWKLEGVLYEPTEKRVTQDPQRQSYDVYPNTLTDKANPQKLFKTKSIQWDKANKQQKKEININKVVTDVVSLQQWLPKKNTEADALMEESEEKEGYSNGCSEIDEDYYSNGFSEQDEDYSSNGCSRKDEDYYSNGCSEKYEDYSKGFSEEDEDYSSNGFSEEDEDYSNGCSRKDDDYYSNGCSEKYEDYSNGFSENDEDYYSDSESEQMSLWADKTIHTEEKASDLTNTSLVAVPVTGVLDGIFESGYFVTVTIRSEKLRGVLYPLQSSPLNTVAKSG